MWDTYMYMHMHIYVYMYIFSHVRHVYIVNVVWIMYYISA